MKNNLLLLICLFISITSSAQNVPQYVSTNGLIGWWPFNGNANDESGNLHNGLVNGASLSIDRNGVANNAYSFNGINNSISLGNILNVSVQNSITISGWFCPQQFGNISNEYVGIDIGKKPDNHITLRVVSSSLPKFQCMHGQPSPPSAHYVSVMSNNNFSPNQWYHVVGVYKNNEAHLYINGIEQSTSSNIGNTLSTIPALSELYFGKSYVDNYVQNFYKGKLDDIGIWNRALSTCEIADLFQGTNYANSIIVPAISNIYSGNNASFNMSSVTSGNIVWQTNVANTGWHNLVNNSTYSGVNTINLNVSNVQFQNHLQKFRAIISGLSCADTSNIAYIYLNDTCVNTVIDTNLITLIDTVHVIVNDTNFISVFDTLLISVTDTLIIDILGTSLPRTMIKIKAYPNPAKDHLHIDYGSYSNLPGCILRIDDSLGQVVFKTLINQQSSDIDLSLWSGNGIYFVYIIDNQNNVLDVRKIILN